MRFTPPVLASSVAASLLAACLPAAAATLPPAVARALAAAQVPASAVSVVVQALDSPTPRLAWHAHEPRNPASLAKLVTTAAALDRLGAAYTWRTPVWVAGSVQEAGGRGVLDGSVVFAGSGDPKLVSERLALAMRRLRAFGVAQVRGDFVVDASAFDPPATVAADFDQEPLRPYNVQPQALLVNYGSVVFSFTPDAARGVARIGYEPPLAGVEVTPQVPLAAGPCEDWRAALDARLDDARALRFAGRFPLACGEKSWPVAYGAPAEFTARALAGAWRDAGGTLDGTVRAGKAPASEPTFELVSPPLAEIVRDINKYSNNVMAEQLFLTLGAQIGGRGSVLAARQAVTAWVGERLGDTGDELVVDNGSGLSRHARLSAGVLARLLRAVWAGPTMPEFVASLPVSGLDGTLRRSRAAMGRAHLKTGSLRDVVGVAGYVLAASGRRYAVAMLVNHAQAPAARPAVDALLQWVHDDEPARPSP